MTTTEESPPLEVVEAVRVLVAWVVLRVRRENEAASQPQPVPDPSPSPEPEGL